MSAAVLSYVQISKSPADLDHPRARPTGRSPVDTQKSTVYRLGPEERDTHPHACTDGLVYLTYTAYDEEVGDEVERLELVPCRRCAELRKDAVY
jgi:hypothetical protein